MKIHQYTTMAWHKVWHMFTLHMNASKMTIILHVFLWKLFSFSPKYYVIHCPLHSPLCNQIPMIFLGSNFTMREFNKTSIVTNVKIPEIPQILFMAIILPKLVKAIGGVFCMWHSDESPNHRNVNAFYGMEIYCSMRKIW